ncbi:MAG TPA: 30S ribosomal protein S20 [Patescibacteria group bacterium]
MPVTKSAKKKLRKDIGRTLINSKIERELKELIKEAKTAKTEKAVIAAVKATDKAAKNRILHKNKAARIKSSLSKILGGKKTEKTAAAKTTKKAAK